MLGQRLDDGAHVADADALFQQVLQDPLHGGERQRLGHQVFDQLGGILGDVIEQLLGFLPPEQFGGVGKDQVIEVGGDDGAGIDHRIAHDVRLIAQRGVDPDRRQAEGRILGRRAGQGAADPPGIDGEIHARIGLAGTDFDTLERDAIGIRLQFQIVADMHRRRQEADLLREFLAQAANALEQLAILALSTSGIRR